MDYALGVIWALGTIVEDDGSLRVVIRHKDVEVLKDITNRCNLQNQPYYVEYHKGWTLKFTLTSDVGKRMVDLGYNIKKDKERSVPEGFYDKYEWMKGYFSQRAHIHKGGLGWVLRIYGSFNIVSALTKWLNSMYGVGLKKPQRISNCIKDQYVGECWAIIYQSKKEIRHLSKMGILPEKEAERLTQLC